MRLKRTIVPFLWEIWDEFQKDECGQLAAALSYYATFSIFPLLILLLGGIGFFLGPATPAQEQILLAFTRSVSGGEVLVATLETILNAVAEQSGEATLVGGVTLLIGISGVFGQLDWTFNKIWNIPEPPSSGEFLALVKRALGKRLFAFGMTSVAGLLLVVSLVLTAVTSPWMQGATTLLGIQQGALASTISFLWQLLVTLAVNTLIFALIFKYLPDTQVAWRDVAAGALISAVVWEIAKQVLAFYIGWSRFSSAYGAIGTLLAAMAWLYFSSQILFMGAEFTKVYTRRYGSRATANADCEAGE
jgi:membrane protein